MRMGIVVVGVGLQQLSDQMISWCWVRSGGAGRDFLLVVCAVAL